MHPASDSGPSHPGASTGASTPNPAPGPAGRTPVRTCIYAHVHPHPGLPFRPAQDCALAPARLLPHGLAAPAQSSSGGGARQCSSSTRCKSQVQTGGVGISTTTSTTSASTPVIWIQYKWQHQLSYGLSSHAVFTNTGSIIHWRAVDLSCVPQEQPSSRQTSACPVSVLTAQCGHNDLVELLAVDLAIAIAIDPSLADHLVDLLSVGFSPRLLMMWEARSMWEAWSQRSYRCRPCRGP